MVQNIQHSIARPVSRPKTTRGSHHSWNLAQYPHIRSNVFLLSNASRRRYNWVQVEHSTSPSSGTNSTIRNSPTYHTSPYLSNQIIEIVARLSGVRLRWGQGQSKPVQETGPHQEILAYKLSSGNQSLDEQLPRVYLCSSGWVATSPNSEVSNALQAHSTPPPQYSHGRGESPSLTLPPYEDSPTIQVTADANPSFSRSEVSLSSYSLHHPECWIWSHLHHQWLMIFRQDHLPMLWRYWLGFSFLFLWIHPKLSYLWTRLWDLLSRPISFQLCQCLLDEVICTQCQLEKILLKWQYWRWRSG